MKRIVLLLALLTVVMVNLSAQEDIFFLRYAQPDYVTITAVDDEIEFTENVKIGFEYLDNTVRMRYYYEENGEWVFNDWDVMEQTFDSEMFVVEEMHYRQLAGGELELFDGFLFEYSYSYDDQERVNGYGLLEYKRIDSDEIHTLYAPSTIKYNEKGQKASALIHYVSMEDYPESESYRAEYMYDNSGNITEERRPYDEDGLYYESYRYKYGSDGRISKLSLYVKYDDDGEMHMLDVDFHYNSTPLNEVKTTDATAYIQDGILYISSDQQEDISIYSTTGSKLYTLRKEAGKVSIPAASFSKQVLIIKGNAWARKLLP